MRKINAFNRYSDRAFILDGYLRGFMDNIGYYAAFVGCFTGVFSMAAHIKSWAENYLERPVLCLTLRVVKINNKDFVELYIVNYGLKPQMLSELVCFGNNSIYHYGDTDRWQDKKIFPLLLEPAKSERLILMSKEHFIEGKHHAVVLCDQNEKYYPVPVEYVDRMHGGSLLTIKLDAQSSKLRKTFVINKNSRFG